VHGVKASPWRVKRARTELVSRHRWCRRAARSSARSTGHGKSSRAPGSRRSKAWKKSSARGEDKTTVEEVERIGSALALGRHVENLAAGGGEGGRHSGGLQSRNRAAPEEEEKGSFSRTYL
jgi:hypothetical protein